MAVIGFFGLGHMGIPMAANLVRAGYKVYGFDLVAEALAAARCHGVKIAESAGEAVADADIVITMLPTGKHVNDLYEETLAGAARPGTLFIDCSTIDVASSRRAHMLMQRAGMSSVDAPVSGGVTGATKGTLTFMVGGEEQSVERASAVLEAMGQKVVRCGAAGNGQAAKICNNLILGISMIATCEAFALGEKLGLSAQGLFDVVSTSSGQCWSVTSYCPVAGPVPSSPANHKYKPGFTAQLMLKDLELARNEAATAGAPLPLGTHASELYAAFNATGQGGLDFSAIINYLHTEEQYG